MRKQLLLVLLVVSCGRTPFNEDPKPAAAAVATTEAPLSVFTGANCPSVGTEPDLTPLPNEGLALVRFRPQGECSGAGGEWFIGREVGSTRGFFVGDHTCYFHPPALRDSADTRYAVVRFNQTAALFHTPTGWCLTNEDGTEPATTDAKSLAWGVYATEAGARAAYERLRN